MVMLLLTYDATEAYYDQKKGFREDIVRFLISKGAFELHSYVESTIQFQTNIDTNPLATWNKYLTDNYNKKVNDKEHRLYFTLCRVAKSDQGFIIKSYEKFSLDNSLQEIVKSITTNSGGKK